MKYVWLILVTVLCCTALAVGAEEVVAEGGVNWLVALEIALPILILALGALAKKYVKVKRYLDATMEIGRIVFAAIEDADAQGVKNRVRDTIECPEVSTTTVEVNSILHAAVDVEAAEKIPPIKRFWRRLLKGKNLPGVVARVALNGALAQLLERKD